MVTVNKKTRYRMTVRGLKIEIEREQMWMNIHTCVLVEGWVKRKTVCIYIIHVRSTDQ